MERPNVWLAVLASLPLLTLGSAVLRDSFADESINSDVNGDQDSNDLHAKHRKMLHAEKRYQVSRATYRIPELSLVNTAGNSVLLPMVFDGDRPVILSFIFTSCTTICPVLTATLAQAEGQLMRESIVPKIISVSIDPEFDTPKRLQRYAKNYEAGRDWTFLTGDERSIVALQRAFDVYRGDKMNHRPTTFLRASDDQPWVRLEGFTTAADLVREYRSLLPEYAAVSDSFSK